MSNAAQNSPPNDSKTFFTWPSQEEIDEARYPSEWEIEAMREDDPERAWALELQDWKDQGSLSRDLTKTELEALSGRLYYPGAEPVIETLVVEALARHAVKARKPRKSSARLLRTHVGNGHPVHSRADLEGIHRRADEELNALWEAGGELDWAERYS